MTFSSAGTRCASEDDDKPDPRSQFGDVDAAEPLTENMRGAGRRVHLGGGDPEQRRLACAVGPEDDPSLVEFHLPGDRTHQRVAPAADEDVVEIDEQIGIRFRHGAIFPHMPEPFTAGSIVVSHAPAFEPPVPARVAVPPGSHPRRRRSAVRGSRSRRGPSGRLPVDGGDERRIELIQQTYGIWHGFVAGVGAGQRYGYRAYGPWDPVPACGSTRQAASRSVRAPHHGDLGDPTPWLPTTADPFGRRRTSTPSATSRCRWSPPPRPHEPPAARNPVGGDRLLRTSRRIVHRTAPRRAAAVPRNVSRSRRRPCRPPRPPRA